LEFASKKNHSMPKVSKPKTVADKVVAAIVALNSSTGSSRQAIAKYLKAEFDTDNASALKKALKIGVTKGVLVQDKQSFFVMGHEIAAAEVDPSERLGIEDVKVGDGDEAISGSTCKMSYVGTLESGEQFDAAKSFTFMIDGGEVIKGWDRGVKGMKVGGTRKLVIGCKLGYGKRGSPPEIPPSATLLFTIKLLQVA
jgi:FKBP-type peptidyl-prolyl cis-trans isomerase